MELHFTDTFVMMLCLCCNKLIQFF